MPRHGQARHYRGYAEGKSVVAQMQMAAQVLDEVGIQCPTAIV
jgi:hypothetical protein